MSPPRIVPALLAAVIAATVACDRAIESARATTGDSSAGGGPPAIEVVAVLSRPLDTTSRLEGDLSAYESVALYARVAAFVSRVHVDRGSAVAKGAPLVELVAPELQAQSAEADAKARAAASNYERLRAAAVTPGAVAGNELEAAAAAASAAQARVRSLRALEEYLHVTAPFDAVVTERDVHPGALVGPQSSTPMLRLEQQNRLRLTVAVPEPLVATVVDGAVVPFTVRSWPGEAFTGVIRRSSHSLDPRTRTMAVELDVDNASRRLAPGMFAEIAWPVRRSAPSLFVPASAVVQSTEGTFVVRVEDGVLRRVAVSRAASMGDRVEVMGDLRPGDLVVRRANEELRDGERAGSVREVPSTARTAP